MKLANLFQWSRNPPEIPFAGDEQIRRLGPLVDEFAKNILFDEEPLFISDEATIWDVSLGPDANELIERCLVFYGVVLDQGDLKRSLWSLIERLNHSRTKQFAVQR